MLAQELAKLIKDNHSVKTFVDTCSIFTSIYYTGDIDLSILEKYINDVGLSDKATIEHQCIEGTFYGALEFGGTHLRDDEDGNIYQSDKSTIEYSGGEGKICELLFARYFDFDNYRRDYSVKQIYLQCYLSRRLTAELIKEVKALIYDCMDTDYMRAGSDDCIIMKTTYNFNYIIFYHYKL